MSQYELFFPNRIVFGNGKRHELPKLLPAGNVLFVCGRHSVSRIWEEYRELFAAGRAFLVDKISPEPPLAEVERCIEAIRRHHVGAVVAIGGGSVIDAAKVAAVLAHNQYAVADYFYGRHKIEKKGVFFVAMPTTAGTGAEITPNSVLIDPETSIKQSVKHPFMFADIALVDPELTFDCPPLITAGSGMDALTQAIEGFISRGANRVSKLLAKEAAKLIFDNLADCQNNPAARSRVAEGSMLGAMAFTQSGLGSVHGIGHPLGSLLHVPHGVCCAILLTEVLKFNRPSCDLNELAAYLGLEDDVALIQQLSALRQKLGLPDDFKAYGLKKEHYSFIVKNCRSGSMKTNPRDFSDAEVVQLLESLS